MSFIGDFLSPDALRRRIEAAHLADETAIVDDLLATYPFDAEARRRIHSMATDLVRGMREQRNQRGLEAFLHEYGLSTEEGVMLMCVAEALLRIPDAETANRLIRDKLGEAHWGRHLGHSDSLFVNASTWALLLTGQVVRLDRPDRRAGVAEVGAFLGRLVARSGEPVIRQAMVQAMRILGRQFVMGRSIHEALKRAEEDERRAYYRYSYDMLGEAARTAADASRYFDAYAAAIAAVGRVSAGRGPVESPGVSIKLSALHPRFEQAQRRRVLGELAPHLRRLAHLAAEENIGICVDAEEADRLDLSLDVIAEALDDEGLDGWNGFGLAVQAYQKRASAVIDWLADLARRRGRRLMLRLVKGAYWDSEIKRAQEQGLGRYPVFTRKMSTDLSYLTCAEKLLADPDAFYPQFATHNAHTLSAVLELADGRRDLEFQRLHGMGRALYDQIVATDGLGVPCRVYAPVGSHEDLLAYLVRRLLENGANTSFINRLADDNLPVEDVIADPADRLLALKHRPHPRIPLPKDIYQPERSNSRGIDLGDPAALSDLAAAMEATPTSWEATPLIGGKEGRKGETAPVRDPADLRREVGSVRWATPDDLENALATASKAAEGWDRTSPAERAACLDRAADLMEANRAELMAICVREAGRTVPDALAEVREAVDFCRYYAARARADFTPLPLPGPTGEMNRLELHGRGVFACISPWNFPLSIFTGQVTAALAAGNAVIAKPAEQTPLIAARAVRLLLEAGVPGDVLHLLPGDGPSIGAPLVKDPRVAGVVFTGSVEVAHGIAKTLAARRGPIVPLIAETGGQNALIADSTALPEQVVADALRSAYGSSGQRCSSLRVMFLQEEIAERVITMLTGAMDELVVGDPGLLETDVGPVIDEESRRRLMTHARRMTKEGRLLREVRLRPSCRHGTFFAPRAFEIPSLDVLKGEVFGPILHILRYQADHLDAVIDAINGTGYGLTLGIHSRLDSAIEHIHRRLRVGNTYVNRSIIGAVVGTQPFGGEGLSGTGPKAGGPHYLQRFAVERSLSVNVMAAGGNAQLLSLDDAED
jgi:RHH-type proline utilization regulon transcriptional repressor/proline dehydrogenase/delta 1-pyrroline-5-carboxylate dehydrogenase